MKIAMVSEHASPLAALGGADGGGQNVHVAELARVLGADGHDVTVYTRRTDPHQPETVEFAPGARVRHVPAGPAREIAKDDLVHHMPEFAAWLAAEWAGERPDIVHAHFWMSGTAALEAAERVDVPVVQTFHALGTVKRRFQGARDTSPSGRVEAEKSVARRVDMVIATSSAEVRELRSWGVAPVALSVVPCGVDLDRFTPEGPAAPRGERPRLLSLGRLVERKGVETIVRALPGVPDAELVIAGGPAEDELHTDAEAMRLRAIAEKIGVAERVRFIGRVSREDVPALLRSADVSVNVPWYEPFGIAPVEAMACGVPVVASRVGGHLDTMIHDVTGLLVPPRDPAVLARRLRRLLADPVRMESYGIAGADRAAARYSWPLIGSQTLERYEEVLRRRSGERTAVVVRPRTEDAGRAACATPAIPSGGI
ncbi:Glycosyltransferase involved in cell wall bisynthesis [Marinactinospora thermotolerans DSM 45154]|uniref:Glycosyltransferase involved in cell wall bisynthesis n=1 Tax=Marinactinospora thermotolerans DSM 45154 TaxID=1122192 RepID=A0A1T4K5B0_9ACTN|nr:glycosyltransferase [Marinactinospora thermotolerans]SJZ37495.1 Glycosyltransferase involved in cell wall bisynthesis [Marinactinospora thermotolerans DSM 45154]